MAEAVVALSLAANIVQFIDFSSKFVSKVLKIYQRGGEKVGELPDFQIAAEDLQRIVSNLQSSHYTGERNESGNSLLCLLQQCRDLAGEILDRVRTTASEGKVRKRDALMEAFRMTFRQKDIHSLQTRLDRLRQELILHLLDSLRSQAHKSLDQQETVLHQLRAVDEGTKKLKRIFGQFERNTECIGPVFLDALMSKIDAPNRTDEKRIWQKDFIAAIYHNGDNEMDKNRPFPSIPQGRKEKLQSVFLNRFRFSGMENREGQIAEAYGKTFKWIFGDLDPEREKWSNFKDWLESDSKVYWITGKPGSGKSTLMKFICHEQHSGEESNVSYMSEHSRCEKYLKKWAAGSKLIIAAFFSWNSGTQLQMSQRGLLLSLLFQILRQSTEMIPFISPSRWEALCLFNEDPREWTDRDLHELLLTAISRLSEESKICLFIDGLDEFNGKEHNDILRLFKDLILNHNMKICVSSRPWVVFENEFKHRPSLMLQNFTYSDIKDYVVANFHENSGFAQLRMREQRYADEIVENVVSKASGVFLWVHLVVTSLLAGMRYGDRVCDLQRRLDSLPDDLEKLYEKILLSLDPFYLEHAAQLFALVRESAEPPSMLLLSFADEEAPEAATSLPVRAITHAEVSLRFDIMKRRLNSRCKGFLEISTSPTILDYSDEYTVQYLHRTVKDYLLHKDAQKKLDSAITSPFDPHLRLCAGTLAHLKVIRTDIGELTNPTFWALVSRCLYNASRVLPTNRSHLVALLEELNKTGIVLAKLFPMSLHPLLVVATEEDHLLLSLLEAGQWVSSHPLSLGNTVFGSTFLSLTVRYGIVEYIVEKANQGCLVQHHRKGVWPLLLDAIYMSDEWKEDFHDTVPHPDTIACLLKMGADPNFTIPHRDISTTASSVWLQTLHYMNEYDGRNLHPSWVMIAKLMIQHGAEINRRALVALIEKEVGMMGVQYSIPDRRKVSKSQALALLKPLGVKQPPKTRSWSSWVPWSSQKVGDDLMVRI